MTIGQQRLSKFEEREVLYANMEKENKSIRPIMSAKQPKNQSAEPVQRGYLNNAN